MKVNRHGKPSNAYLATLKRPKKADYMRLVQACLDALINGGREAKVIISFPYVMKFPKDFPKGWLVEKREDGSNVRKVKAKKLLAWLNGRGHTEITYEMLDAQQTSFTFAIKKMEGLIDFDD